MDQPTPKVSLNSSRFSKVRVGFLCFQIGLGAVIAGTLWLWLAHPSGDLRSRSLLLPILFGFGIPGLLGWIALTVASPFFAAPFVRRLIAWLPAVVAIILLIGRQLAREAILYEDDLVLATGMAGVVYLTVILVSAEENGKHPPTFIRRGTAAVTGILLGTVLGWLGNLISRETGAFVVSALAFAIAGILRGLDGRPSRSPWILAERSVGRFARLVDLLGTEAKSRQWLLLFGCLFGLTITATAWLPALWSASGGFPGEEIFGPGHLFAMVAGLLLGIGCGSQPFLAGTHLGWRPGFIAGSMLFGCLGMLALIALDPVTAAGGTWLIGLPLGLVGRLCREELLSALDRKGVRIPRETEAMIGTFLCGCLLIIGGFFAIGEWTLVSPLPAIIFFVSGFVLLSYFCWKLGPPLPDVTDVPPTAPAQTTLFTIPDFYLSGFAPSPETAPADDGCAVTILYEVPEKNLSDFREAMAELSRVRRREGALQWRLSRHMEHADRFTESYLLESWSDYQEAIRHENAADRAIKQRVFDLNDWDSLPHESHEALEEI